jgi:hypothetical protein
MPAKLVFSPPAAHRSQHHPQVYATGLLYPLHSIPYPLYFFLNGTSPGCGGCSWIRVSISVRT